MRVSINGKQVCEIERQYQPIKLMSEKEIEAMINEIASTLPSVDSPKPKESILTKSKNFLKTSHLSVAPFVPMVATVAFKIDSEGVFWNTFLEYIFPWMLDIAKVYCLIRIAQAFYQEKRGGRDSGTGFQALLEHGKWYLIFWLLPIGVELIDQVGHKMFEDMSNQTLINGK